MTSQLKEFLRILKIVISKIYPIFNNKTTFRLLIIIFKKKVIGTKKITQIFKLVLLIKIVIFFLMDLRARKSKKLKELFSSHLIKHVNNFLQ